ncbi:MAG: two-component sensor histidine kinase [Pseudonocardiales bacterium]|nr:MAG: two-component sensor histidine kinase [Pseudonocardiales bacterium]
MMALPLRLRLSFAFTIAIALLLAAASAFLYLRLATNLSRALDLELRQRAQDLIPAMTQPSASVDPLVGPTLIESGESFAEVLSADGAVLDSTRSLHGAALLTPAELSRARHGAVFVSRPRVPGLDEPARLLATPIARGGQGVVLVVGATLQNRAEALSSLRNELLVAGPLTLLLTGAGGYLLAGAALRPVEAMRRRAAGITAGEPGERLPIPPGRDELARLGETLNDLLSRLEAAMERERSFVADASHELRTPLTTLRTELELALRHPRPAADLRAAISSAVEETERLAGLADDLLLVARADQGQLPIRVTTVEVAELLSRTTRGVSLPAGRALTVDCDGVRWVSADPQRIEQALRNLVDNAVRHGAGDVAVTAVAAGAGIELHVRDHGDGFPAAFLPHAFERFSRPDGGRTGPGAGLGLSIVQAIAVAHGGRATIGAPNGSGADVWLSIPHQPPTPGPVG